ncbi:emp24/gp25L/p24 family/GOLD-domain-containing protein, partial [Paraphysoderma sedebokerense]
LLCSLAAAVRFDLSALATGVEGMNKRCLRAYVPRDVVVKGTYHVSEGPNQRVSIQVVDNSPHKNQYYSKSDLNGDGKFVFTTHDYGDIIVCFLNTLDAGLQPSPTFTKSIHLTLDTGAEAKDDSAFDKDKHLKPVEIELSRLESMSEEIVDEMEYLKTRLGKMRNTNESTNDRVKWFAILTISLTIGVGVWQVFYLKQFFKSKKLI